ncbi:MAG: helix-turn-helix domain-containing protein [Pseudomonadota bacterium]|nr:helix-turn-helix domain-containing protein [Pseudomonadota bacterium]
MTDIRPGRPVRGSTTGRPVMAALDLFGRRWALRIIWELRDGPLTFRSLRDRADDASPTVLNTRLKELRDAGLVAHQAGDGYALTGLGQDAVAALQPLCDWAGLWAARLDDPEDD